MNNHHIINQLEDIEDYRPYFTYWITSTQVIVMIFSLLLYGFGPVGVELYHGKGQVLSRGLFIEEVEFLEPSNFWLGPRPADLIHLGSKFSPCMRPELAISKAAKDSSEQEANSGCCIRNDNSGCVQTSRSECSSLLSTWHRWTPASPGPDGRISGPVCGQDPRYCSSPRSSYTDTWADNMTSWPLCLSSSTTSGGPNHMTCEVIGRPCCIGIHGKCEIRTKEYCDFVNGHFHMEASLCSQVSCMEDVCGMISFASKDTPDQIYRVMTSLFLHAGLLHLIITSAVQLYLLRDLEKLCGPFRMAIIYFGSGFSGNLASAIFIPHRSEAGPAGSQFGILACLIVEVINVWPILMEPKVALSKLGMIFLIFLLIGFMPWVDNYAHIAGFITGFFLSYAIIPFITFSNSVKERSARIVLSAACLTVVFLIFTISLFVFYFNPIETYSWCKYLTCIPITEDFCADQNINLKKDIHSVIL